MDRAPVAYRVGVADPDPDPDAEPAPQAEPPEPDPAARRRQAALLALGVLIVLLAAYGLWARLGGGSRMAGGPQVPGELLVAEQARGTSLPAVGRTKGLGHACTAWLLDVGAAAEGAAYAVTNGHCVGIDDSTSVLAGSPRRGASVEFNAFASEGADGSDLVATPVEQVAWASMRWTDTAVLRLGTTYGELAGRGIDPIRAAPPSEEGAQILVAGVPVAGIPADQQFLRGSRCQVGATTDVIEHTWMWVDMRATDCAGILGGSSGSPAFNPAGEAVGMVNTTTIGAPDGHACSLGQPCEVREGGVATEADTTYLLPVDALALCFPDGRFALGGQCPLEDPAGVVPAAAEVRVAKPGTQVELALGPGAPGNVLVSDKSGSPADVDCADVDGWSPPRPVDDWTLTVTLPDSDAWVLVCVGSPSQPTPVLIESDGTAPDPGDIELTQVAGEGVVRVEPVLDPPDQSQFLWASGPSGSIACATAEGYTQYRGIPAFIEADDLPATVCVVAIDEAGNRSIPATFTVAWPEESATASTGLRG